MTSITMETMIEMILVMSIPPLNFWGLSILSTASKWYNVSTAYEVELPEDNNPGKYSPHYEL